MIIVFAALLGLAGLLLVVGLGRLSTSWKNVAVELAMCELAAKVEDGRRGLLYPQDQLAVLGRRIEEMRVLAHEGLL